MDTILIRFVIENIPATMRVVQVLLLLFAGLVDAEGVGNCFTNLLHYLSRLRLRPQKPETRDEIENLT